MAEEETTLTDRDLCPECAAMLTYVDADLHCTQCSWVRAVGEEKEQPPEPVVVSEPVASIDEMPDYRARAEALVTFLFRLLVAIEAATVKVEDLKVLQGIVRDLARRRWQSGLRVKGTAPTLDVAHTLNDDALVEKLRNLLS